MFMARKEEQAEDVDVTEGARRATGVTSNAENIEKVKKKPDPEVSEKANRRRLTANYKLRILRKIDKCSNRGEVGALLRREGLYSSTVSKWRKQRLDGELSALQDKKRGRKRKSKDIRDKRIKKLERENRRLQQKLRQAETIIDVQKKVSTLLGIPLKSPDDEGSD